MLGKLNRSQIDNLLQSEVVGRIGCHADGKTYIVPITYVYDSEYILCHTADGMKTQMMQANRQVCFQVDKIDNMANWRSAIIWGTYEELKGEAAEEALLKLVNRVHPLMSSETSMPTHGLDRPHGSFTPDSRMVVFQIKVEEASGRFEKS